VATGFFCRQPRCRQRLIDSLHAIHAFSAAAIDKRRLAIEKSAAIAAIGLSMRLTRRETGHGGPGIGSTSRAMEFVRAAIPFAQRLAGVARVRKRRCYCNAS
jgi:hypothetical protein